jgi:hypothetical protein
MNQKSPDWPTCTPSLMDQAALTNQVLFGTSTSAVKTQIWIAVSISLLVVALRQYSTRSRTTRTCGEGRFFMSQTRKIIASMELARAAEVCPRFSCISLAERAVTIDCFATTD